MLRLGVLYLVLSQLVLFGSPTVIQPTEANYFAPTSAFEDGVETALAMDKLQTLDIPYSTAGEVDSDLLAWCEDLVAQTFTILPEEHVDAIHRLTLSFDPDIRRGMAGGNTLVIRCADQDAAELVAVLTHEIGHVVDTGYLHGSAFLSEETPFVDRGQIVYSNDPSVAFYSVSWEDDSSFTDQSTDFISEYATTNPYEEFAESYAAYVLHGPLFRFYAYHNETLAEKYDYFRDEVFDGVEFSFAAEDLPSVYESKHDRVYDITRLDYNLESFLSLLEPADSKSTS